MTEPGSISFDEKTFGMLAHLLALFTGFLGPLIIWLIKKEESEYVSRQAKESLNFQITIVLAYIGISIVSAILVMISNFLVFISTLLYLAVFVGHLVFVIMATMKANNEEEYEYPISIRLIK